MSDAVSAWYAAERETLKPSNRGGVLLGGIVYGPTFLRIFKDYCLPTLRAPANHSALRGYGAALVIYTDSATRTDLHVLLGDFGIDSEVRVIPDVLMRDHDLFWSRVSAAMGLLVVQAVRQGMAFHMLMPDQVYSERYFPGLFGLAMRHRRIAHNGLNAKMAAAVELDGYRLSDGTLSIPARNLGDIAWRHMHWRMSSFVMNDIPEDRMPDCHYQLWRARDRAMMFSPHNNTAFMDAETCRQLDRDAPPTATLDAQMGNLFGSDYYVPSLDDCMTFIGLEWTGPPTEPVAAHIDRKVLLRRCRANAAHYTKATEIALSDDPTAPTAEEIWARQHEIVNEMKSV